MSQVSTLNFQDVLLRSRKTILTMMASRGYNTQPYEKLGGSELVQLAIGSPDAIRMDLEHKNNKENKAVILYSFGRIKQSLARILNELTNPDSESYVGEPSQTEVVYILMEELADTFHSASLEAWLKHKLRIQFFHMPSIVVNPMEHVLQPKFNLLPTSEHDKFLKTHFIREKKQLPGIRFHSDMVARYMSLVPGDIVEITRPSPASGEYNLWRVCVP